MMLLQACWFKIMHGEKNSLAKKNKKELKRKKPTNVGKTALEGQAVQFNAGAMA